MHQVLFGSALLISFLGGVVALLAPCCASVMLPAYFATGFGRRTGIAAAKHEATLPANRDPGPGRGRRPARRCSVTPGATGARSRTPSRAWPSRKPRMTRASALLSDPMRPRSRGSSMMVCRP